MSQFVFINEGVVRRVEECDLDFVEAQRGNYQCIFPIEHFPRVPSVGWLWDGFTIKPDIKQITPRQARQAIVLAGLSIPTIEAAINSLPEPNRSLALIEWEYSTAFIRDNPLVDTIGLVLGLSPDQIDDLWIMGSKL